MLKTQRPSEAFVNLIILIAAISVGLLSMSVWYPSTFIGDTAVPIGHDSFYHARRILDTIKDLGAFFEFDNYIHRPEGSWITWPWAYDYLVAYLVKTLMATFNVSDPWFFLRYVAPFWLLINITLVLGVASRLGLGHLLRFAILLVFALLPSTRGLHGIGVLDHHFIELFFVLGVLYFGLGWFNNLDSKWHAASLGIVLGIAPAFHNSLFILQVPVVLTSFICWPQIKFRTVSSWYFCISLILSTLIFLLYSEPFQLGFYKFYLFSWFHLSSAFATACIILGLTYYSYSLAKLYAVSAIGLLLITIILISQGSGIDFLFVSLEKFSGMQESQSLIPSGHHLGWELTFQLYTGFIICLPLVVLWALHHIKHRNNIAIAFLAMSSICGIALMLFQARLQYFGMIYLLLIPALWCNRSSKPNIHKLKIAGFMLFSILAFIPSFPWLTAKASIAGNARYNVMHSAYLVLSQYCKDYKDVVLADMNDGHYIRYNSNCAVIANNFIISRQHEEKIRLVDQLFNLPPHELKSKYPWIRYILVKVLETDGKLGEIKDELRSKLLRAENEFPKGFILLAESNYRAKFSNVNVPVFRIFKIL